MTDGVAKRNSLDDLVLEHYTEEPLVFDRNRTYEQNALREYGKPRGFWVSVAGEDDWPQWCRSEEFHVAGLKYRSVVKLKPDAAVLMIGTGVELDAFHKIFSVENRDWQALSGNFNYRPLNWQLVTEIYQGIIITPYLWSHRLSGPSWYYGFDCASGCIWDVSAIESVTPAGTPEGWPWDKTSCDRCGALRSEFNEAGECLACQASDFMKGFDPKNFDPTKWFPVPPPGAPEEGGAT